MVAANVSDQPRGLLNMDSPGIMEFSQGMWTKEFRFDRDLVFFNSLSVTTVHILLLALPQHLNGLVNTFPMDGFAPNLVLWVRPSGGTL